jgi:glycosyltransferase involved in cell wall biosynthesis
MISIVIPLYNAASTIVNTLESVRKQEYDGKVEIIIINDGSLDDSLDIVTVYSNKHRDLNIRIFNKTNGGVASARNIGIKEAMGEFIALLDSDDEWMDNKLKVIMPYFNDPEIECIGSSRNGRKLKCGFKIIRKLTRIYPIDLVFRWNPQTSTVVFRKSIVNKIGFYNENLRYAEDGDYWLRIAYHCGFFVIPDSLVVTGKGKHDYGESGLSGNLKEMYKGECNAITNAYTMGGISLLFFLAARTFAMVKYIRRKIVVGLRN